MRKLVVSLSVLFIVIALAGPFAVGRLLAGQIASEPSPIAAALPAWAVPVASELTSGWFRSQHRMRVVITETAPPEVLRLVDPDGFGDEPALIVQSQLTHGPIVDGVRLGLVQVESAYALDNGVGEPVVLGFTTNSVVGLLGNLRIDWRAAQLVMTGAQYRLGWPAAEGRLKFARDLRRFEASFSADQIVLQPIATGVANTLHRVSGNLRSEMDDVAIDLWLDLDYAASADGSLPTETTMAIGRLPQTSLPGMAALAKLRRQANPPIDEATFWTAAMPVIRQLPGLGLTLELQQSIATETSPRLIDASATFEPLPDSLPADDPQALFDAIRGSMTVLADVELPAAEVQDMSNDDPLVNTLRGMGMLQKLAGADRYQMQLRLSAGELRINEVPVPMLPLQ